MNIMSSQKRSVLIQDRIIKDMNYGPRRNKDSGDSYGDDKDHEIKSSLITSTNLCINIRQVRMWQNCEYIVLGVDVRSIYKPLGYFFKLTHLNMKCELKKYNASSSHGTKTANQKNINIEMSFTIKIDDTDNHFNRWKNNYRQPSPWNELNN